MINDGLHSLPPFFWKNLINYVQVAIFFRGRVAWVYPWKSSWYVPNEFANYDVPISRVSNGDYRWHPWPINWWFSRVAFPQLVSLPSSPHFYHLQAEPKSLFNTLFSSHLSTCSNFMLLFLFLRSLWAQHWLSQNYILRITQGTLGKYIFSCS